MNVTRTAFFLFTAGFVVSCNTFKPAAKSQINNNLAAAESKLSASSGPRFVEGVQINPQKVSTSRNYSNAVMPVKKISTNGLAQPVQLNTPAPDPAMESLNMLQFKYAIALDVPVEQITNLALFQTIDEWYGTRYRFGGSTKKGIDCSSLMQKIYESVYNREIPRTAVNQYAATMRIQKEELQEGDLIFFHTTRRGISHVGLYLGNNKFVHASSSRGVVISDLTESYYINAYRASGRFVDAELSRREEETEGGSR
jgi:cell wall-associated NlpC family hydrolase